MRVTQSTLVRNGLQQIAQQRARLARTQEQAASGLRVNRPSDDPVDYRTVQALEDSISQTGHFLRAIDVSRTRFRATETAITDAVDLVAEAKTIAIAALNTSNQSDGAAEALRTRVEGLFSELLAVANTRSADGAYVFSGITSDRESFVQTGVFASGSPPPTVAFDGDASVIDVEIDEGVFVDVTADGSTVFQSGVDVFAVLGALWQGIDTIDAGGAGAVETALGDLQDAESQLLLAQSIVGSEESKANTFEARLQAQEAEAITRLSRLEDADVFEVYSKLTTQETALQASLSINARILTPTLLDFL